MNWNDVTFSQYLDILDVYNNTELDEADRAVKLCEILFDVNILKLPVNEYGKYISELAFTSKKLPKAVVLDHYEINGRKYKLVRDVGDITVAMYFDFRKKKELGADIHNYPELMTCFFVPEGKSYGEGYSLETVKDDIMDMPVTVVNEIANFWQRTFRRFIRLSLSYLQLKLRKLPKKERKMMKAQVRMMQRAMNGVYSLS